MDKPNAYAQAGVDVDVEAKASRVMYEASRKTFANRRGKIGEIISRFDDFAGLKIVPIAGLPPGSCMSAGADGAGTKVVLPQRLRVHSTIGFDLMAMLVDDAAPRGGEAGLILSVLDITSLGTDERYLPIIEELAKGYVAAAKEANVGILNGEIAQLGALISGYGEFPFNWSGACIWFGKEDRLFSGKEIRVGDAVVVLREPRSPRANGFSLLRKIFAHFYGDEWHNQPFNGSTIGAEMMAPSTIYARLTTHLHGGFDGEPAAEIHGFAHITGGGIPEKLGRTLRPSGLGARLWNLYPLPPIVRHCQELTYSLGFQNPIPDSDLYKACHGGQAMAVITPEADQVIDEATELGFEAQHAGEIVSKPGIIIRSMGVERSGMDIKY